MISSLESLDPLEYVVDEGVHDGHGLGRDLGDHLADGSEDDVVVGQP